MSEEQKDELARSAAEGTTDATPAARGVKSLAGAVQTVVAPVKRVCSFALDGVWDLDVDAQSGPRRQGVQLLRFVSTTLRGFSAHKCALHAAGLTYFSLLSVIPVLMLMLLLTKPCGMYDWARAKLIVQTDEMIQTFFEGKKELSAPAPTAQEKPAEQEKPVEQAAEAADSSPARSAEGSGPSFAQQARELRDQIMAQIDAKIGAFNFGFLALLGFLMLAWTVVSTFGQVEDSFNEIWEVRKGRPLVRRAYLFVGALMVLPLLTTLAMSLPVLRVVKASLDATLGATSYTKWAGDALVALLDSSLFACAVNLFFSAAALAFLFKALPNRTVSLRAAAEGGVVTAVLLAGWMNLCAFVQFGISSSSAAFGSFALIPILIVWINLSWKIILLGSSMAYAFQCIHGRVRSLSCE